jgi:hypothetical protein
MTNSPPALSAYLDRIHQLAGASTAPFQNSDGQDKDGGTPINAGDPRTSNHTHHVALLLSHAYARYLGDLSGGQTIRYTLGKAYDLDLDSAASSGPGVAFYEFKELRSSRTANQGELKRIKEWFKEGMNDAGEKIGPVGKRKSRSVPNFRVGPQCDRPLLCTSFCVNQWK